MVFKLYFRIDAAFPKVGPSKYDKQLYMRAQMFLKRQKVHWFAFSLPLIHSSHLELDRSVIAQLSICRLRAPQHEAGFTNTGHPFCIS